MIALESGDCDGPIGTEFVISLVVARNVIRESPRFASFDSHGQQNLRGALGFGKLARTGRQWGMTPEVQ